MSACTAVLTLLTMRKSSSVKRFPPKFMVVFQVMELRGFHTQMVIVMATNGAVTKLQQLWLKTSASSIIIGLLYVSYK